MDESAHRFGYVALIGRPNAGKSTLLNRVVGEKVAIVTHKPQTTRHRITGIHTTESAQVVYVDTPGLHQGRRHALNRRMNQVAEAALEEVDLVVAVIDARNPGSGDRAILARAAAAGRPLILALNKVDGIDDRGRLLPVTEELVDACRSGLAPESGRIVPAGVFYISALKGDAVNDLQEAVVEALPEGPPVFEADSYTDRSVRFLAAELIREQLMLNLHQELPYGTTVEIERFEETDGRTAIGAVIHVNEDRHKGMVIGRGGETLKRIGTRARIEIEKMLGWPVHLDVWVRTTRDWINDPARLQELGL